VRVSVIGQGYVGLTIAVNAAAAGHRVVGYDLNEIVVKRLNTGYSHIEGIDDSTLKSLNLSGNYLATNKSEDMKGSEVVVIAVPTPLDANRLPDLKFVEAAVKSIIQIFDYPLLIINESTSYPGTLRKVIAHKILEATQIDHLYAASPERVDPGNATWSTKNTPRLLSGLTAEASKLAHDFYSKFCDEIVFTETPEIAEMAKLFENTFRQVNIALVNEFAQIAHALNINPRSVIEAASTKPYGFMKFNPGAGVGGHCIPVDPSYLSYIAESVGIHAAFIDLANMTNLNMPKYVVDRVIKANGGSIVGKKVGVIGVSYKANIADVRETPAESVIDLLRSNGAQTSWHDELVNQWRGETSSQLDEIDIAVVLMLHDNFDTHKLSNIPYIFDCTGQIADADGI